MNIFPESVGKPNQISMWEKTLILSQKWKSVKGGL